jgi:protocatechuate 3,4-dioxygenase beta subunit
MPSDLRARFPAVLDVSEDLSWSVLSDELGAFRLDPIPFVQGALFRAELKGREPFEIELPPQSQEGVVVVLARPTTGERLVGRVVDASDQPVEGAWVSLGRNVRESGADGGFEFDVPPSSFVAREGEFRPPPPASLLAAKPGFLPARLEPLRDSAGAERWPDPIVLRLVGEPFGIRGRVVDSTGAPLAGIAVWIADPTYLGGLGDTPRSGARMATVESLLAGADQPWHVVETREDGRFELQGLEDRAYAVEAMDPRTLLRARLAEVAAGERDALVVLPSEELYPTLAGQVVDWRGAPIRGVRVAPQCDALRLSYNGETISTTHAGGEPVVTDEEGRFELEDVPRDLVYLRLDGADTLPLEWGRHVEGGLGRLVGERELELRIVVQRRAHFQVELADPQEADALSLLDAAGTELEISDFRGSTRIEDERQPIVSGRSNTLAASDTAVTIVLWSRGVEVRRASVDLVPGERTVLRP